MRKIRTLKFASQAICLLSAFLTVPVGYAQDGTFKNFEIRVIKNRFFEKHLRVETAANVGAIMNQTFDYSYLANGTLAFHITESIGLFAEAAYVKSFRKGDCDTLGSQFNIEPIKQQLDWFAGGGVVVTPIYGKFQMLNGEVLYFDWFFNVGGGTSQVGYRKENTCIGEDGTASSVQSRSQFNFGTGQRFFLNKNVSLNWSLRFLNLQPADVPGFAPNDPSTVFTAPNQQVMFGFGASYFL